MVFDSSSIYTQIVFFREIVLLLQEQAAIMRVVLSCVGMTSSPLNPNGVGLDANPALVLGKPKMEFAASQVNLAQGSGQCYTTLKPPQDS